MYLMALLLSIELTMGLATVNVIAKEQFMIRNMELENTKLSLIEGLQGKTKLRWVDGRSIEDIRNLEDKIREDYKDSVKKELEDIYNVYSNSIKKYISSEKTEEDLEKFENEMRSIPDIKDYIVSIGEYNVSNKELNSRYITTSYENVIQLSNLYKGEFTNILQNSNIKFYQFEQEYKKDMIILKKRDKNIIYYMTLNRELLEDELKYKLRARLGMNDVLIYTLLNPSETWKFVANDVLNYGKFIQITTPYDMSLEKIDKSNIGVSMNTTDGYIKKYLIEKNSLKFGNYVIFILFFINIFTYLCSLIKAELPERYYLRTEYPYLKNISIKILMLVVTVSSYYLLLYADYFDYYLSMFLVMISLVVSLIYDSSSLECFGEDLSYYK